MCTHACPVLADGGGGAAKSFKNPLDAVVQIVQKSGVAKGLYTGIDAPYVLSGKSPTYMCPSSRTLSRTQAQKYTRAPKNTIHTCTPLTDHTHSHYAGIDAAYLRQWTYGSCRVGIYAYLLNKFTEVDPKTGKKKPVLNALNTRP